MALLFFEILFVKGLYGKLNKRRVKMDFIGNLIGGIIDAIFGLVFKILQPVIEWLVEKIVAPIVMGVVDFVRVLLSNTFYTISCFLLRLIDFVEMLFRALAGLPNNRTDGANITLTLGEGGGGGDLLLQLLKSGGVQQAFLSMCVVGIFLLVVTTVFQIIKNEYTTEGAKNAKGPIFQKAFKGLTNLLLLPLLVVFGIIFANQLLNLLDIATKSNAGATISGQLFVTAATEAQYSVLGTAEDDKWIFEKDSYTYREIMGISLSFEAFITTLADSFSGKDIFADTGGDLGKADESVNDAYATQSKKYYLISQVSKDYDFSRINYLLLILGACIILKVLFFTCFGLVLRLYKCAVLFIISPAIIGMTPINEGGLGKWRTSFIGQVLAAYGTVLSINLFFIVVGVLLNIKVSFTGFGGGFDVLSGSLMTALLKCIFVIAGCILIEKFTKELGGYFGADDAASAGKDLAKQVGQTAANSGKVAVAAGAGAYKLNRGIAKAGVGLAKRVGKTGVGIAKGAGKLGMKGIDALAFMNRRRDGYKGKKKIGKDMKFSDFAAGRQKSRKETAEKVKDLSLKPARWAGKQVKSVANKVWSPVQLKAAQVRSGLGFATAKDKLVLAENARDTNAQARATQIRELEDKLKIGGAYHGRDKDEEKLASLKKSAGFEAENDQDDVDKAQADYEKDKAARKEKRDDRRAAIQNRMLKAKDWFGMKAMNTASFFQGVAMEGMDLIPGSKMLKNMQKAQDTGAEALGEGFVAANKDAKEKRKKRREDAAEADFGWALDAHRRAGGLEISKQMVKNLEVQQIQNQNDINRALNDYNAAYHASSDPERQKELALQAAQYAQQHNSEMSFDEVFNLFENHNGKKIDLNLSQLKLDFDVKALQRDIQESIAKGMASTTEGLTQAITKAVQKQMGEKNNPQLVTMVLNAVKQAIQEAQ